MPIGKHRNFSLLQIFKKESKLVDTEIEFYVTAMNNLDDFLFEVNTEHMKKESAKKFDMTDIVFVFGDERIDPW